MTVRPDVWAPPDAGETYERGRPDYPAPAVDFLVSRLGIGPASTVADLGAGTGKLTRALLPRAAAVVAVEPMAGMRSQLARAATGALVAGATAENLPLRSGSIDAVTAAQAFHWFRADAALAEIHRVLRPGGGLALMWNKRDESVPWVARMSELLDEYERLAPRESTAWSGSWIHAFERSRLFSAPEQRNFPHEQRLRSLTDRVGSMSFVIALPEDARAALLARIAELVTDQGDEIRLPYVTHVYWCTRA